MFEWTVTFVLVFLINIFYTRYLQAVQKDYIVIASSWSAAINISASIAAINYIDNHWLIIPSCLGSFAGTYVSMRYK